MKKHKRHNDQDNIQIDWIMSKDKDGSPIYGARVYLNGDLILNKLDSTPEEICHELLKLLDYKVYSDYIDRTNNDL